MILEDITAVCIAREARAPGIESNRIESNRIESNRIKSNRINVTIEKYVKLFDEHEIPISAGTAPCMCRLVEVCYMCYVGVGVFSYVLVNHLVVDGAFESRRYPCVVVCVYP